MSLAQLYLFRGNDLLVVEQGARTSVPTLADLPAGTLQPARHHLITAGGGIPAYAAEVAPDTEAPEGMRFAGLRSLYGRLDGAAYKLAGRGVQIVDWDRTHQFCGRCGTALQLKADELVKQCPRCSLLHFPRLAPAVIVLIRKGNEILLGRAPTWTMYSNLAGFVEPGETLEEAVHREVMEEVGVTLKNLRYFGSQPWPFPHSLMIGFTAEYAGGEIRVQESELAEARWFALDNLPELPQPLSIARKLIDWAVSENE